MLSHPSQHPARFEDVCASARKTVCMCLIACGMALLLCVQAHAQGGVPLITVATDQTPLNLSNQFGIPAGSAINQNGDFAFVGNGGNALFFRAAGASTATRLLQVGDAIPLPAFAGSQVSSFSPIVGLNSSKSLLFEVFFGASDGIEGISGEAILTYDGMNYHTVVSSADIAPGSGGAAYGFSLTVGGINDEGDVSFSAVPIGKAAITYYIVPSGLPAVRIVASDDPIPPTCTWCSLTGGSLGDFFAGTYISARFFSVPFRAPQLNAKGQMLISLWGGLFIGSKDQPLYVVPLASPGICGPPAPPTGGTITGGIVSVLTASLQGGIVLNNLGAVAFVDTTPTSTTTGAPTTNAICVAPAGGTAAPVVVSGDAAPAAFPGGTLGGLAISAMDDAGDIAFSTGVYSTGTTGTTLTFALLRYHQSSRQTDVVAYNGEVVPGSNGATFASPVLTIPPPKTGLGGISLVFPEPAFSGVSMANDGVVSFHVQLAPDGNAICQQMGTDSPLLLSRDGQTAPVSGGGTFDLSVEDQTITLDHGLTFYSAYLTRGTGDFAEFLGTTTSSHTLMSTGDDLPLGARTTFVSTAPKVAGKFVVFMARHAGGRTNLLETDISPSVPTTTRIVSDGDIHVPGIPGFPSATSVSPNFFVNENGEVAFEIQAGPGAFDFFGRGIIPFGSGNVNSAWFASIFPPCGAIYLWSPSTAVSTKVVASGDMAPNTSTPFSCVALNSQAPSPLNKSGQLAFSSPPQFPPFFRCFFCGTPPPTPDVNGVFLYSPGGTGTISEIAAANNTLSGETQQTTFVPYLSVPVNSTGQVAFGAQVGTPVSGTSSGFQGFFLRKTDGTLQKVVSSGDIVPNSNATFLAPHYITGLDDSGNFTFTAATSTAADGIFFAPAGGGIQTIALDGGPAPSGGTFALSSALSWALPGTIVSGGGGSLTWVPGTTPLPGIGIGTGNIFFADVARSNGESDVVFRAGITGGTADSGYFRLLRGGAQPVVQPVVLQGQVVPGVGTINTIPLPLRGAEFALGPDGELAFVNNFTSGSIVKRGLFIARPDGTLETVLSTGDTVPGGGTLTGLSMTNLAAGEPGKFAFSAGIKGGSARQAIFVTALPPKFASTTVTVTGPLNSSISGQPITLTATVNSPGTEGPTGNVSFSDSGVSLGMSAVSVGQASLNLASLPAGSHSVTAKYSGDTNFASSLSSAVPVYVMGFAPPPTNLVVAAGQSVVIPLTLFAAPDSNLQFTFSCSGLPAGAACVFGSNPMTPGTSSSGTPVQLTFSTKATSTLLPSEPRRGPSPLGIMWLAVILSAILAAGMVKLREAPRRRLAFGTCLAVFALAAVLAGCGAVGSGYGPGAGSTGTPRGAAAITVTAASSAATVNTVVNVTVQ